MADGFFDAFQDIRRENALLRSQGLDPTGFGSLIEAGSLENLFGGDQQVPVPQQDLQQVLTDQFDPRSVDPLGISGRAAGQTGAESLRFGTPPPDLQPVITPRSTQSREQVTRSLARLQTLDPSGVSAKFAMDLITNRNAADLTAAKLKMDEVFKETTNLLRVKDPVAQERQIIQTIRDRASKGIASPALQKILELPIERRVVGLEQRKTIATDVKTISENEQKELDRESTERIATARLAAQPGQETFTEVKDAQGNIIGQRSSLTGKVVTDPRTPPFVEPQETFTLIKDSKGNILGQRSSKTGKVISDPRTIKPPTKTSLEKNLDAAGITDPEVRKDIIVKSLTKPAVKVDINKGLGYKIPIGFMLLDTNDPTKGVTPIPGGPKDTVTGDNAGKVQMLRVAQKAFKGVRKLVFDFNKKGEITGLQNFNLFAANLGIPFTDIRGVPFTDGDKLRAKMEFGIQGITRIETGAAMPASELDNTRIRFMPQVTDTVEIAKIKLDMYEDFINGTIKLFDPSGRFSAQRFDTEFTFRVEGGTETQIPSATAPATPTPRTPAQPQRNIAVDF